MTDRADAVPDRADAATDRAGAVPGATGLDDAHDVAAGATPPTGSTAYAPTLADTAEADPDAQDEQAEPDGGSGADSAVPTYQRYDCTGDDFAVGAEAARAAVERGECVVLPTDTVYGVGADAFSADAVQRLLDAKGRGRDMPPAVLIADARLTKAFTRDVPQAASDLMARHWPGALTVILPALSSLALDLGETGGTIALRVPDHPLARDLLRRTGPLAVSSANRTGEPAALTVDDAVDMLGNAVSVYLDGGTLGEPDTLPSTMVDFSRSEQGQVLRPGAISLEVLRETVPELGAPPRPRTVTSATDIAAAIHAASTAPDPVGAPTAEAAAASTAEATGGDAGGSVGQRTTERDTTAAPGSSTPDA